MVYFTHDVTEVLFIGNTVPPIVAGAADRQWMERIIVPVDEAGFRTRAATAPKLALNY